MHKNINKLTIFVSPIMSNSFKHGIIRQLALFTTVCFIPYHFIVMPSKAALFNARNCDMVFDFGVSHRNTALYNPHGNDILLYL